MEFPVREEEQRLRDAFDALAKENDRLQAQIRANTQRQFELRGAFALLMKMKAGLTVPTPESPPPASEVSDG